MKLDEKIGTLVMSEGLVSHKFRVNINRQSFRLLYGDLYSNRVKAVVRELSTNAYDSHVSAGKVDTPFEVHLPNELEPFFAVTDFGTGLSPDQVCGEDGIYITFCESDKTGSDDYTGCLGLGSKSPLSYTDNFTVESNYNGEKHSYAVFLNEAGEPCITPLGSCPTSESNGLKVFIAVKEKDFEGFVGEAADVLSWFKVKPNVVGHANFKFAEHEYLRSTDRYAIHKERQQGSRVVMGNVAYPITVGDFRYNQFDDIERAVVEYGVDLFVNVGAVQFVPSREKLSYTDKTVNNVKDCLKGAIKSIREELESQVQAQPSVWKARCLMDSIKHSVLGKVRSLGTVMYNGKEIAEYINFHKTVESVMKMDRANPLYPKLEVLSKRKEHYRRESEQTIYCDGRRIYLNDLERGGYQRIRKHAEDTGTTKNVYMVSGVDAAFLEETGIDEVAVRASTLPVPERKQREVTGSDGVTRSYVKRTVLQQYVRSGSNYMTEWWSDVEVDPRAGGVYVTVTYGQILDGENKTLPSDIRNKYTTVKVLRPDFCLFGIRPAHMGRVERYKHRWTRFDDYAKAVINTEVVNNLNKLNLLKQYNSIQNADNYDGFLNQVFEEYSVFGQFVSKLRIAKEADEDERVKAILRLATLYDIEIELGKTDELYDLANRLHDQYPLMGYIDRYQWSRSDVVENFSEYVRAMDDRRYNQILKEAV